MECEKTKLTGLYYIGIDDVSKLCTYGEYENIDHALCVISFRFYHKGTSCEHWFDDEPLDISMQGFTIKYDEVFGFLVDCMRSGNRAVALVDGVSYDIVLDVVSGALFDLIRGKYHTISTSVLQDFLVKNKDAFTANNAFDLLHYRL